MGSDSFSDLINRLNLLERLSKQDSDLVAQVSGYRDEVTQRKADLEQQIADQKRYTAASGRGREEGGSPARRQGEGSQGQREAQIAQLEKEEAERQAALAAAARKAAEEAREGAGGGGGQGCHQHHQEADDHAPSTRRRPKTNTTGTTGKNTTTTKTKTTTTTKKTTTTTDAPSSGGTAGGDVVDYALNFLGTQYVWGGSSPSGFDCSGFAMYVYKHFGIYLPHSSRMQSGYGAAVSRADLQPGDLVFFFSPIHHVGIYIGDGKMVNAAGTGKGVRIDYVWTLVQLRAADPQVDLRTADGHP